MSSGLECAFVEVNPWTWYWMLESEQGNDFDWIQEAEVFGPFKTYEEAHEHLRKNRANPGGHAIYRGPHGEYVRKAIERAERP